MRDTRYEIPEAQYAVQLVGPDKLVLNKSKEVFRPGRHQILCRVEAVGLCFSDLKLLKQFSSHVRKSEIVSGIDPEILKEIPSYVPGERPTVPGHETVVRIEAVGAGVEDFKAGERYLVQTDYRWLHTSSSNGAFGYNLEGALQEYVLMDERVITSPEGDSMLIPVSEALSGSAIALVEPWACVEDAYASRERRSLRADGQMLVVVDAEVSEGAFGNLFNRYGSRLPTCGPHVTSPAVVNSAHHSNNVSAEFTAAKNDIEKSSCSNLCKQRFDGIRLRAEIDYIVITGIGKP